MPVIAAAAALASAGGLYKYQRENFMFDAEQRIKREYQAQDMKIKQFELYREDIRDLVELTVSKMDNYLIVNTLQLGFCIILFTEGQPSKCLSPSWLIWLYSLCTVGAFFYFLLSIWLSIHASIAAHSFGVRLLTQLVRLPTPNTQQLDAARAKATDYEGMSFAELFRIPLWKQQLRRLAANMEASAEAGDDAASEDGASRTGQQNAGDTFNPVTMLQHVKKYRELQAHWQCYDAYARVSMNVGTNQLLHALCYFVIVAVEVEIQCPWAAFAACGVMASAACLLMRLDVQVTVTQMHLVCAVIVVPPLLTFACLVKEENSITVELLAPIVFLLHALWIGALLWIGWACEAKDVNEPALPTRFRTVLYLDVFSWIDAPPPRSQLQPEAEGGGARLSTIREEAGGAQQASAVGGLEDAIPMSGGDSEMVLQDLSEMTLDGGRRTGFDGRQLPQSLHDSLVTLCWQWRHQLELDIRDWEKSEVQFLIEDDPSTQQTIKSLRARFDYLVRQLRDAEPEGEHSLDATPDTDPDPVWLKLEWNPSGHAMIYFYNVADGRTIWTVPENPARIFDIEMMIKQVDGFQEKVMTVVNYNPVNAVSPNPAESTGVEASAIEPAPADTASGAALEAPEHSTDLGIDTSQDQQTEPVSSDAVATPGDASMPRGTSGTPYGGFEAVQQLLDVNARELGSDTFHPHRASLGTTTTRRRPPGLMPWRTFFQASVVLLLIWILGFGWVAISPILGQNFHSGAFTRDPKCKPEDSEESLRLKPFPGELQIVHEGMWPHPYFRPEGLACRASLDTVSIFILERYSVHELEVPRHGATGQTTGTTVKPALEHCLSDSPEFQAGGLEALSLDCSSSSLKRELAGQDDCAAILFGKRVERNGTRAMIRCSMDPDSRTATVTQQSRVHGRDWRTLSHGRSGELWATKGTTLVNLRARASPPHDFVPVAEVSQSLSRNLTHIQVLPQGTETAGSMVLGLTAPSGKLHLSILGEDGSLASTSWRLPDVASSWHAFCAVEDAFFLAGTSALSGKVTIWRAPQTSRPRSSRM